MFLNNFDLPGFALHLGGFVFVLAVHLGFVLLGFDFLLYLGLRICSSHGFRFSSLFVLRFCLYFLFSFGFVLFFSFFLFFSWFLCLSFFSVFLLAAFFA